MRNTHPNGGFAVPNAIPVNRTIKEARLPPELRDLAELLADIVAGRMQAGLAKLPNHEETQGVP